MLFRSITLLRKPNGGQSSARNFGVARSKGELIALLDQDDMWYRDHLRLLAEPFLAEHEPELGWVYGNLDEVDRSGKMVTRDVLDSVVGVEHPKRDLIACLKNDMFILPSASLIRRTAFDAVGGFDETLTRCEDIAISWALTRAGYSLTAPAVSPVTISRLKTRAAAVP